MTRLESVTMKNPLTLHGIQVRYLMANTPIVRSNGETAPGWELYLHAEWSSVVVREGAAYALVPLGNVESMLLAEGVGSVTGQPRAPVGPAPGPGRPRSKRLALL